MWNILINRYSYFTYKESQSEASEVCCEVWGSQSSVAEHGKFPWMWVYINGQIGPYFYSVCSAFVSRLKRMLQSFETLRTTHPATHYHVPEDSNLLKHYVRTSAWSSDEGSSLVGCYTMSNGKQWPIVSRIAVPLLRWSREHYSPSKYWQVLAWQHSCTFVLKKTCVPI